MKISQLKDGENSMELAVLKIEEKLSKNGKAYSVLTCGDGESSIEVKMWKSESEVKDMTSIPAVVHARIDKQIYQGAISYIMKDMRQISDDVSQYIPHAPINPEECYGYIIDFIQQRKNQELQKVTLKIIEENKSKFISMPAAKSVHHNYRNGLLYHTYRMLQLAQSMTCLYPDVDEDLLFCGTILHDIGKVLELYVGDGDQVDYSIDGRLLGHCVIGIQMVERAAAELGIASDNESIRLLQHLIASHHGELEIGAIVKPMIQEAMLLHEIDMIESRKWQYEKVLSSTEAGTLSERVFGLGGMVFHPNFNDE